MHDWLERFEYPFRSGATWHFWEFSMLKEPKEPWQTDVNEWWKLGEAPDLTCLWSVCRNRNRWRSCEEAFQEKVGFNAMHNVQWQEDSQLSKQFVFHGSLSLLSFLNAAWKTSWFFTEVLSFVDFLVQKKADVEHFLCCYRYFLIIQDKSVVYTSFAKPDPKAAFVSTNSAQTFEVAWCESSLCGISWSIGNVKPKAKLLVTLAEAHADERTGCANKIIVWWERVSWLI